MVEQARNAFGLGENDVVLGQHKVRMFHYSYYSLAINHSFTGTFNTTCFPQVLGPTSNCRR